MTTTVHLDDRLKADVSLGDEGYPIVLTFPLDEHETKEALRAEAFPPLERAHAAALARVEEVEHAVALYLDRYRDREADAVKSGEAADATLIGLRTIRVELQATVFPEKADAGVVMGHGASGYARDFERNLDASQARALGAALWHYAGELEAGRR